VSSIKKNVTICFLKIGFSETLLPSNFLLNPCCKIFSDCINATHFGSNHSLFGRYMAVSSWETLLDVNESCRASYLLGGVRAKQDMTGWRYAQTLLYLNLVMGIFVYLLIMFQGLLNPTGLGAPTWHLGLHTMISFLTNTDQQHYSSETTLSYLSQVAGLAF